MTVSMYGKWLQIVLFLFLWVLFSCLIFVWFYWLLDSNVYIKKNFFFAKLELEKKREVFHPLVNYLGGCNSQVSHMGRRGQGAGNPRCFFLALSMELYQRKGSRSQTSRHPCGILVLGSDLTSHVTTPVPDVFFPTFNVVANGCLG